MATFNEMRGRKLVVLELLHNLLARALCSGESGNDALAL
jgi:hypothetical protein